MTTIAAGRAPPSTEGQAPVAEGQSPFCCNTCLVVFRNSDIQKIHMKGDWHRYNLRRRVTGLPPVSPQMFSDMIQKTNAANTQQAAYERLCVFCQKTYFSENSYQNHISSQKHKSREANAKMRLPTKKDADEASSVVSSTFSLGKPNQTMADSDSQIIDSDAEEEFTHVVEGLKNTTIEDESSPVKRPGNPAPSTPGGAPIEDTNSEAQTPTASRAAAPAPSLKLCLFCNYASPTMELSIAHMERFHGMFIPEKQFLVDLEGLLEHLQSRIREDHECIYCGKLKMDVYAIQTHMRDKAHCKIPYMTVDEQVEIGEYYDFRSTYSDDEDDDESTDENDEAADKINGVKNGDEEDDDGWETDSSASSLDSDDLSADNKRSRHSQTDSRAHRNNAAAVYYDEYELHLPSGRAAGHRSLNRYYRQNLHHYPSAHDLDTRLRLSVENSGVLVDEDAMDVDDYATSTALARNPYSAARAVAVRPARGTEGMRGVTDAARSEVQKMERSALRSIRRTEGKSGLKVKAKAIGSNFKFTGRGKGV